MKKISRLVMAGMIVLAMSGCDDNDTLEGIQSVNLNDLNLGYKVTVNGSVWDEEMSSIAFCPVGNRGGDGRTIVEFSNPVYTADNGYFDIVDETVIYFDEFGTTTDTESAGTLGTLDVDVTYQLGGNILDYFEITKIEEYECPEVQPR